MGRVGLMLALLLLTRGAFAEGAPNDAAEPFALAWVRDDGAESCPAGRDFADEVARRLGRSPFDARAERSIEIRVGRDDGTYRSRVWVRGRDGSITGRRELSSEDCGSLFSATALAVALVIDPEAARLDTVTRPQAAEPPKPLDMPRLPAAPELAAPPRAPAPPPAARAVGPAPAIAASKPASVSGDAALTAGLLPRPTPGVELRVLGPAGARLHVAAEALYATPSRETTPEATLGVGLTAFSLAALLELVETRAFGLGAEAGGWAGALHVAVRPNGTGSTVQPTHPGDFLFFAASLGLRARANLTRAAFLEADARAMAALLRRRLDVTASGVATPAWTEPVVGGLFTAGFGLDLF